MKNILMAATLLALPFGLSACDKPAGASKAETTADTMGSMAMPAETKLAKGSGTVTAIDTTAEKITLDHSEIPAVGWPAMKMEFDAKPELLKGVAVGDKVDFNVTVTGSTGEVTAIVRH
jgi:Cu/Ag efflux protein CusF